MPAKTNIQPLGKRVLVQPDEVEQVTNLDSLPREDKYAIWKLKFFQKYIFKIPLIRRFKIFRRNCKWQGL